MILKTLSSRLRPIAVTMGAVLMPSAALAHPGHGAEQGGLMLGLLHPLSGYDHLAAMLLAGAWAGILGGRARFLLPLCFTGAMLAGFLLAGTALSGLAEWAIALSVVGLALATVLRLRLPVPLAGVALGLFGLGHGLAHGLEAPDGLGRLGFVGGFLITSAALHLAGLWVGSVVPRRAPSPR